MALEHESKRQQPKLQIQLSIKVSASLSPSPSVTQSEQKQEPAEKNASPLAHTAVGGRDSLEYIG